MPGVSVTVAEQIEALRGVAGDRAVALIRREPDPVIADRRRLAARVRRRAGGGARLPRRGDVRRDPRAPTSRTSSAASCRSSGDAGSRVVTGGGSGIGRAAAVAPGRRRLHGRARRPARGRAGGRRPRRSAPRRARRRRATSRDPASVRALFADVDASASAGSTCCSTTPASARRRCRSRTSTLEQWQAVVDTNLTGAFLCTQEAFRVMKRPDAARRPDHQQRLDLGARRRGRTPRRTRPPSTRSPGSPSRRRSTAGAYDIACGQIDIGNAGTEMTARMADGRAAGRRLDRASSRRWTSRTSRAAVVYMATLPLDANVQFMTVMATKMPFVGRG